MSQGISWTLIGPSWVTCLPLNQSQCFGLPMPGLNALLLGLEGSLRLPWALGLRCQKVIMPRKTGLLFLEGVAPVPKTPVPQVGWEGQAPTPDTLFVRPFIVD